MSIDAVQLIVNTTIAVATIAAVVYAIISGRSNSKNAQKSLDEAVERRMDDSMPILERTPLMESSSNDFFEISLTNVGEGKLFNFGLAAPQNGVSVSSGILQVGTPYKRYYKVKMNFDEMGIDPLSNDEDKISVEYKYQDKYGRTFHVTHNMEVSSDGSIGADYDVEMPRLIG